MHRLLPALATSVFLFPTVPAVAQDIAALDTLDARLSYLVGHNLATGFAKDALVELDIEALLQAIDDVKNGEPNRISEADAKAVYEEIGLLAAEQRRVEKLAENAAFLERNATVEGITTTESGLQYQVVEEGSGDSPAETDTVTVHYEGRLLDETVFDSSIQRGEPASFPVNGVIRGWQEALQLMKPGAKWEVWIPSELAYGPQGAGRSIGPDEVLNFSIELISIDS
ncbi:peptidyl-prolyl cis-trans isomerase [Tateyamaria omphalii]|uniref:FKBP-type peptidyl-prolyl cis-trans isomerase n=1 Tax=Tateyamaria omphalii TaxID=299262 RepID=UPI001678807B|nr:FKBP-type peptidyl-prolyl cis-trans isomerase [Tateyamaria omphalii]GGX71800.1 peptidyl-prolyl cis-trans isomerase [Tateyamaria omphalii]